MPVIAGARLRRGNVASAAAAGRLLAQAINTARAAGAAGRSWSGRMSGAGSRRGPGPSRSRPSAVFDEELRCFISSAEVAETDFVAFTGRRKAQHITCRLVVRRVKRLQPQASDGTVQGELLAAWRHHAFITNSALSTAQADQRHRNHAIVEQVIAELKDGPLAHLPSGSYPANAAWVSLAVIAFNLARAAAVAAGLTPAR